MKRNFTLLLCAAIASFSAKAQSVQWQKLSGGTNDENFSSYTIQQTNDGGYIEAGFSNSSNTGTLAGVTGNGGNDGWITKFDASGAVTWQKLLGGIGDDLLYSVQQTTDNGYILAGYTNSSNSGTLTGLTNSGLQDGWIIKLDATGATQWQKLVGGSDNDYLFWIRQTSDGYIMAGQSFSSNSGTLTGVNNNGSMDGWIIKLDATGTTTQWQKLLGGGDIDFFRAIQPTADGGYLVGCGSYAGSSNNGTLTGVFNNGFGITQDAWIVKLDAAGATQWQKLLGGTSIDNLITIQEITGGGYIAAGYSNSPGDGTLTGQTPNSSFDGWVIRLDASGNTVWQKLLGGSLNDLLISVQQTADGGFIAAGYSNSSNTGTLTGLTTNGGNDGWLIKFSAAGVTQWQNFYGGAGDDFFQAIRQGPDGSYIVGGVSGSSNTGTLTGVTGNGGTDGWIVKLSQFILPIALGEFSAKKTADNAVQLDWFTLTEQNNRGFNIERSDGDLNSFTDIGFVTSKAIAGTSSSRLNYTYADLTNKYNGTSYYRLRQTDIDGVIKFSNVSAVKLSRSPQITLQPNPAGNLITLKEVSSYRSVMIVDFAGKIKLQQSIQKNTEEINISSLPAGIYLVRLTGDAGTIVIKLMKQY